jgi:hypothetical protein
MTKVRLGPKLEKQSNLTHSFTTKLNAKCPWPPILPKQPEYILHFEHYVRFIFTFSIVF